MTRLSTPVAEVGWRLPSFLLFAAALLVVGPAEASRTTDARPEPASLELPSLELVDSVESSPRFGFGEDLGLLDPEAGPGGFVVFAVEAARCELTYARNNPLRFVDPDGRVAVEGARAFYDAALEYLRASAVARGQVQSFEGLSGRAEPTVRVVDEDGYVTWYNPDSNTVYWNPSMGVSVRGLGGQPGTDGSWEMSPAMVLLHEIGHVVRRNADRSAFEKDQATEDAQYGKKEERRNITRVETPAAKQLGEATRKTYGGSPTSAPVTPTKRRTGTNQPCGGAGNSPCERKAP